jgi:hypothetical protein
VLPSDRFLVLGDKLLPPTGYEADALLATTFSLDLVTALGLPLALIRQGQFADRTAETASRLAVIEAIKRFSGSYRVFCDVGGIRVPPRRWRALSLLDQIVVPVSMPPARRPGGGAEATPTFHPKIVVVRFVRSGAPARIRVVCMSRNLTTDAALDVSAVIEGEASGPDSSQGSDRLASAIETLLAWTVRPDHQHGSGDLVRSIASTLRETRWQPPAGFQTVTFHPYGFGRVQDRALLEADEHRLLVISPFLSPARLRRLTGRGAGHVLVSDPAALIEVGTKALEGFAEKFHLASSADFTMASGTAHEPEEDSVKSVTGLHAKLYVAEGRRHTRWLIGSGNATEAAVTANAELLVELRSAKKTARIDELIDPVDGLGRHLVPYTPDPTAPEEPTTQRNEAEIALRALASSTFRGSVTTARDGRCQLEVLVDPLFRPPAAVAFTARVLGLDTSPVALRPDHVPAACFPRLARKDLSPYIAVTAVADAEQVERVVTLVLEGITAQELADDAVVAEVQLNDPLDYLAFVLSGTEGPEHGLTFEDQDLETGESALAGEADSPPRASPRALLEPLLQTLLSQDPNSLGRQRVLDVEQAITAFGDQIPREFREMWAAILGATR